MSELTETDWVKKFHDHMAARFRVVDGPVGPEAANGISYDVLLHGCSFGTQRMAFDAMCRAFDEYAEGRSGSVYLRVPPEMNSARIAAPNVGSVHRMYVRLAIVPEASA